MRAPTCLLALLCFVGCEPMADPGSPFEPVRVAPAGVSAPVAEATPALDPLFPTEEPIVIHSSELGKASAKAPAAAPAEQPAPAEAGAAPQAAPTTVPAVALTTPAPAVLGSVSLGGGAWPLRLVATVPSAQPPRAILGLPGGGEVVVTPGTMLPEANVVVMAVGAASVELAMILPAGDHAVVQPRTLLSLHGAP
jgi:hypothetical protein